MKRISFIEIPCPYTGTILTSDLLEDHDGYYSETKYPFEDEIMGPFDTIRSVKEYLWGLYGRP